MKSNNNDRVHSIRRLIMNLQQWNKNIVQKLFHKRIQYQKRDNVYDTKIPSYMNA